MLNNVFSMIKLIHSENLSDLVQYSDEEIGIFVKRY